MTDVSWLLGRRKSGMSAGTLSFPHEFSPLRWKRTLLFSRGGLTRYDESTAPPPSIPRRLPGRLRTSLPFT